MKMKLKVMVMTQKQIRNIKYNNQLSNFYIIKFVKLFYNSVQNKKANNFFE